MPYFLARIMKRVPVFSLLRPLNRNISSPANVEKNLEFSFAGQMIKCKGKVGDSLLDVVVNNDLPLDGFGACEGALACCTCHVVLGAEHFAKVEKLNPCSEEEMDLLDFAPDLDDMSRLACQVKILEDDSQTIEILVPTHSRDARSLS